MMKSFKKIGLLLVSLSLGSLAVVGCTQQRNFSETQIEPETQQPATPVQNQPATETPSVPYVPTPQNGGWQRFMNFTPISRSSPCPH